MIKKLNTSRAFELDALRGLAIIMMILHHLIYDLRYVIGLDVFAWQDSNFFIDWIRAPFVFIFLFVSGICCSFSKNNFLRSLKMAIVAVLFSGVFFAVSVITDSEMYVYFNVLHLLALGTLGYALLSYLEKKHSLKNINAILIFAGVIFLWIAYPLSRLDPSYNPFLLPLFEGFAAGVGMADYMPLAPWFGMFIFGALFGRLYYQNKQTRFPNCHANIRTAIIPFEFVGRNSLMFYLFHQPVLLALLYLLQFLGIIG